MKTKAVLILVVGLLVAADDPKDAAKKELDKLQGSWTTASVVYNGKDYADGNGKIKFVFKGDLATVEAKWNLPALTYRDANAKTVADFLDLSQAAFMQPPSIAEPPAPVSTATTP